MKLKIAVLFGLLCCASLAYAQSVQQSGSVTNNHLALWTTNGIIQDAGTAADSPLSSLGVTNNTTTGFCIASGRVTASGRQQLCFGAPLSGPATISLQNYGTASAQNLQFILNGTTLTLPSGGGTFATLTGTVTTNNFICAANTSGLLKDCGSIAASTLFGNPTTSAASPQAFTIGGLTQKASPASNDLVLIQDQSASGQLKYSPVSAVTSVGSVGSVNSATGALTIVAGTGITVGTVGTVITVTNSVTTTIPVGTILDYAGASPPTGFLLADGSCVSQATYASLFAILSTTWGSCSAGNFALPDLRGRMTAMADGVAGRITTAGSGCNAVLATGCGSQNRTISAANIPQLAVTVIDPGHLHTITDPGHSHTVALGAGAAVSGAPAVSSLNTGPTTSSTSTTGITINTNTTGITATANTGSANTALATLDPLLIVNKIIKF